MCTWTCKLRRLIPVILLATLAGCIKGQAPGFAAPSGPSKKLEQMAFYNGAVVVQAPPGYCIDAGSRHRAETSRLVLLASCAALGNGDAQFAEPALIVVSVGPGRPGLSPPTASALANSLATAPPLATVDTDGVALVQLDSGGARVLPGGDPRHWRGATVVNEHLISLAIYGPKGGGVAGRNGRDTLLRLARATRQASEAGL